MRSLTKTGKTNVIIFIASLVVSAGAVPILKKLNGNNEPYNLVAIYALITILALIFVGLYATRNKFMDKHRDVLIVALVSIFLTTGAAFMFRNTPFGLLKYFGDEQYILASITKYKYFSSFVDFSYAHLPAFYPPLYFYVLGKVAWVLHIPAYRAVQLGIFAVLFFIPFMMYYGWRAIIGSPAAVLLSISAGMYFTVETVWKPFEILTCLLFFVWWVRFIEMLHNPAFTTRKKYTVFVVIGGVLGALLFMAYFYWFFIGIVYLLVTLAVQLWQRHSIAQIVQDNLHKLKVLLLAAFLSSFFWAPLLYGMLVHGSENLQTRWFTENMVKINVFGQLDPLTFSGVLLLAGFAFLFLNYQNRTNWTILLFTASCYVWTVIGFLSVLSKNPVLYSKSWLFNEYLMLIGSVLLFRYVITHERLIKYSTRIAALSTVVIFVVMSQQFFSALDKSPWYKADFQPPYTLHALSQLNAIGGIQGIKGKVFLTDQWDAECFVPIYEFVDNNPNYANPIAHYTKRVQMLKALNQINSPAAMAWLLTYNRFSKVDYVWIRNSQVTILRDNFPNGTRSTQVHFPVSQLVSPYFSHVTGTQIYKINQIPRSAFNGFDKHDQQLLKQFS